MHLTDPSAPSRAGYRYEVFGLRVDSDRRLPELRVSDARGPADIAIATGAVRDPAPDAVRIDAEVCARPGYLHIDYPEAAFVVEHGRRITVAPRPGVSDRDVRLYLLGSALGGALHQRGLFALHANAVEIDGRAVAFAGHSGAGKSTLAAFFHLSGYRVLCDDVCVVGFDARGNPVAWPGIPRIKLWDDALEALGIDASPLERVFDGDAKFSLEMPGDAPGRPLPLAAIHILHASGESEPVGVEALPGPEAVQAILSHAYRPEFAAAMGMRTSHFLTAGRLAASCPVLATARSWGFDALAAEAERIARWTRDLHPRGERNLP